MSATAEAVEDLKASVAGFQRSNDEALKQKADKGYVDKLLEEKVTRWNDAITKAEDNLRAAVKRTDDLERRIETKGLYGQETREGLVVVARKFSAAVGRIVNEEQFKAYDSAFARFLRSAPEHLSADIHAAMSVGSDPAGGYYVTPDMSGAVAKKIFETSPIRQIAGQQTISTDALEGINDINEAGSGWVGETTAPTETTTPDIGKYRIPVHEQYAEPRVTQKLLEDAIVDVEAWLAEKVADKLARTENAAFVVGDGSMKPRGFLAYTVAETGDATRAWGTMEIVKSAANGAFAATNPGDYLIDLVYKLKAGYRDGATFVMARATLAAARKLKDGQGNYLWQPDFQSAQGATLVGFPITEAEDMPVLATNSLSLAFGNFKVGYLIVDRTGIVVLRDPYTAKPYVKFYTRKRVGGAVVNSEAIKIMKFAA